MLHHFKKDNRPFYCTSSATQTRMKLYDFIPSLKTVKKIVPNSKQEKMLGAIKAGLKRAEKFRLGDLNNDKNCAYYQVTPEDNPFKLTPIYRGVCPIQSSTHYKLIRNDRNQITTGTITPKGGMFSPSAHNAGDTMNSCLSSWTTKEKIHHTLKFAGPEGFIAVAFVPLGETVKSPDHFFEKEILIPGTLRANQIIATIDEISNISQWQKKSLFAYYEKKHLVTS